MVLPVLSRILAVLASVASTYFVAHYFTDDSLVAYYLIAPYLTLVTMLLVSPVSILLTNKAISEGNVVLIWAMPLFYYLFVVAVLIVILLGLTMQENGLFLLFAIYVFFELVAGTFIGYVVQSEAHVGRQLKSAVIYFFSSFTLALFPILAIFFLKKNVESWIFGLCAARMIHLFWLLICCLKDKWFDGKGLGVDSLIAMLMLNKKSVLFVFLISVFGWGFNNFTRVSAAYFDLPQLPALLFFAATCLTAVTTVEGVLRGQVERYIYKVASGQDKLDFSLPDKIYFTVFAVSIVLAPPMMYLVSSDRFGSFIWVSFFILAYESLRAYSGFLISLIQSRDSYSISYRLQFLMFSVFITCIFLFIKLHPTSAMHFSMLYGILSLCFLVYILFLKKITLRLYGRGR